MKRQGGFDAAAAKWRNPRSGAFAHVLSALPSSPNSAGALPRMMPCGFLHPQHQLCTAQAWATWLDGFKRTFPLYLSLNLVPLVVLKFGSFVRRPVELLKRAILGAGRSSTFMACFVGGYMSFVCAQRRLTGRDHKLVYWLAGLVASASVLLEAKTRRSGTCSQNRSIRWQVSPGVLDRTCPVRASTSGRLSVCDSSRPSVASIRSAWRIASVCQCHGLCDVSTYNAGCLRRPVGFTVDAVVQVFLCHRSGHYEPVVVQAPAALYRPASARGGASIDGATGGSSDRRRV